MFAGKADHTMMSTQICGAQGGRGRDSRYRDRESQKQILEKSDESFSRKQGIVVSQQVEIRRSWAQKLKL